MNNTPKILVFLVLALLVIAGCVPRETERPAGPVSTLDQEPFVRAARAYLAE